MFLLPVRSFPWRMSFNVRQLTNTQHHSPRAQTQHIHHLFPAFNLLAHFIHILNQTCIRFYKQILSFLIRGFHVFDDSIRCFLRSSYDVESRCRGMLGKLSRCVFSYSACAADKDCDEVGGQGGWNLGVGGLDGGVRYHFCGGVRCFELQWMRFIPEALLYSLLKMRKGEYVNYLTGVLDLYIL